MLTTHYMRHHITRTICVAVYNTHYMRHHITRTIDWRCTCCYAIRHWRSSAPKPPKHTKAGKALAKARQSFLQGGIQSGGWGPAPLPNRMRSKVTERRYAPPPEPPERGNGGGRSNGIRSGGSTPLPGIGGTGKGKQPSKFSKLEEYLDPALSQVPPNVEWGNTAPPAAPTQHHPNRPNHPNSTLKGDAHAEILFEDYIKRGSAGVSRRAAAPAAGDGRAAGNAADTQQTAYATVKVDVTWPHFPNMASLSSPVGTAGNQNASAQSARRSAASLHSNEMLKMFRPIGDGKDKARRWVKGMERTAEGGQAMVAAAAGADPFDTTVASFRVPAAAGTPSPLSGGSNASGKTSGRTSPFIGPRLNPETVRCRRRRRCMLHAACCMLVCFHTF